MNVKGRVCILMLMKHPLARRSSDFILMQSWIICFMLKPLKSEDYYVTQYGPGNAIMCVTDE